MAARSKTGQQAAGEKDADENREGAAVKGNLETIVKALVKKGKDKGVITIDEFNKALPAQEFSPDQIEDAMATITDVGIQLIEGGDEAEDGDEDKEEKEGGYESGGNIDSDDTGRTDDPVRMYLREMGSVELLSREGEIAIAKRIEAGREMMIGGICESPLAIESIIAWYEALQKGDILLREVIDLDATYTDGEQPEPPEEKKPEAAEGEKPEGGEGGDGDSEDEQGISLSAMEAELLPEVFEIFGKIRRTYKRMQKVQEERLA
ncbi:MAG TPA: RNA polymerase sigma factor region1.1 domain-containing protein, partial [Patescibacteria group bacterium]|nr:RNA polymerase sigma factor region1.1 domain-containing protein [Patescibacteria group bacterium]